MRQRITFVHPQDAAIDPADITVKTDAFNGPELSSGVREDRFTIGLSELPADLASKLETYHELHIRWASEKPFDTISPFTSRITPGLHLFYTPLRDSPADLPQLCAFVSKAFGNLECKDPESFVRQSTERFSSSTAFQFYQPLPSLSFFERFLDAKFCSPRDPTCTTRVQHLQDAASVDLSYDTISHAVKLAVTWPLAPQSLSISSPPSGSHRTEVGLLTKGVPPNMNHDEIGLAGLLTVLGEHKKPSPVLFSFPSRHQLATGSFEAKFLQPTGLHPTWQLRLSDSKPPMDDASCAPHAYLTLPRTIFADRYQLADELFVKSKNISALRYASEPVDLEKPEYTTPTWGSSILLELVPPRSDDNEAWTAEIPLHLRYLRPSESGYRDVEIPYPALFWACHSEDGTKFPTNPFDRVNLGYDGLFGPRTVFWHVDPKPTERSGKLVSGVRVPVLPTGSNKVVAIGTAVAIGAGFLWVVWCLFAGVAVAKKTVKKMEVKKDQ